MQLRGGRVTIYPAGVRINFKYLTSPSINKQHGARRAREVATLRASQLPPPGCRNPKSPFGHEYAGGFSRTQATDAVRPEADFDVLSQQGAPPPLPRRDFCSPLGKKPSRLPARLCPPPSAREMLFAQNGNIFLLAIVISYINPTHIVGSLLG